MYIKELFEVATAGSVSADSIASARMSLFGQPIARKITSKKKKIKKMMDGRKLTFKQMFYKTKD